MRVFLFKVGAAYEFFPEKQKELRPYKIINVQKI